MSGHGGEMRAVELAAWGGDLEVVDRPVPEAGADEVLVEVEATSAGLSVYNAVQGYIGDRPSSLPVVPGHEIVGTVLECGPGATGLAPGDRVGSYFYLTCGRCDACRAGRENLCANHAGYLGVHADGGYAEYAALPAGNAIALPDGLDPVAASVIPDAVATPYHVATQRADIGRGDDVLVLGAGGGVGIHAQQVAQHLGADVTAVDRTAGKLDACADRGAAAVVDTSRETLDEALPAGTRYDAVIDFTGAMDLVEAATEHLGTRGRVVHLTGFPGRTQAVEPASMVPRESAVLGSRYCAKYELRRAADLVAEGHVDPVVTEVADLAGAADLLARIRDGDVVGRGAVVP